MHPPALTTGVGPLGRQVIHLQPPTSQSMARATGSFDESVLDPQLRDKASYQSPVHMAASEHLELDSDDTQPISGWSSPSGCDEETGASDILSSQTPIRPPLRFLSNMSPSPLPTLPSTNPNKPSIKTDDKENQLPAAVPLRAPNGLKISNPILVSAIVNAEKKIGPPVKKRTALEEQIYQMHLQVSVVSSNLILTFFVRETLQQRREQNAEELACCREEIAYKRHKVYSQEQELIDRRLRELRRDLTDGLIEKEEYRIRAEVLRKQGDEIFAKSQLIDI